MKFSQMKYERPDAEQLKAELNGLTEKLKAAKSYTEAKELFLAEEKLNKHISTLANLAHIRHTIDTRDAFYDGEMKFWNKVDPELEECNQAWTQAMLESPYRKDFAEEYGNLMFLKAEIKCKTFSPVIIEELQKENELADEYEKLLASAQIPFEGGVYTLSQLTPFKSDPDDARRLAAWKAEGNWYKENQAKLDDLYDQLVHLRDKMGKKLGYEGYTTLGYYRMGRNCYTKEDVEKFRKAVVKYLVPVADSIYREQAKRLGKEYPMSFADNALEFRSGNAGRGGGGSRRLMDSAILPSGAMLITCTLTISPSCRTAAMSCTNSLDTSEIWTMPTRPSGSATKAPNGFTPVTRPSNTFPTSIAKTQYSLFSIEWAAIQLPVTSTKMRSLGAA